jgi:hypothetical protein
MFEEAIQKMGEAKASVYAQLEDSDTQITPSVAEAVRNFSFMLDSAYLWLGQVGGFVAQGGTGDAAAAGEAAIAKGTVVEFPKKETDGTA